jgi:cyclopropane fatty-acyl-phospholipid synthase-like methyltransferase
MPNSVSIWGRKFQRHPRRINKWFAGVGAGVRERYRDDYWQRNDPIIDDRLLARTDIPTPVHLLPGQTVLELGCGELPDRALLRYLAARIVPRSIQNVDTSD